MHPLARSFILAFKSSNQATGRLFSMKLPDNPSWTFTKTELEHNSTLKLDEASLKRLERFSMLRIRENRAALARLNAAVIAAQELTKVKTAGIEPLNSLMEKKPMQLREDTVLEECRNGELLRNANVVEEGYLVTPPGNAPVSETDITNKKKTVKQSDSRNSTQKSK